MKWNWWKLLSVLLLGFTFSAGILIPLAPGLISAESSAVSTSSAPFTVKVLGYGTRFKENQSSIAAWIKNDDKENCASSIKVIDDTHLELDFPPIAPLNNPSFGLAVYDDADGRLFMPDAIST